MLRKVVGLLVALMLVLAACAGDSGSGDADDAPPGDTTQSTVEGGSDAGEEGGGATSDAGDAVPFDPGQTSLGALFAGDYPVDSYQFTVNMTFEGQDAGGVDVTRAMTLTGAASKDPAIYTFAGDFTGVEGFEESTDFSMIQIDDMLYLTIPDEGCVATPIDVFGNPLIEAFGSQENLIEDLDQLDYAGRATFNGMEVDEYRFDEDSLVVDVDSGFDSAEGRLYVSREFGAVVGFEILGEGATDVFQQGDTGTFTLDYEVSGLNDPIEGTAPADCETFDFSDLGDDSTGDDSTGDDSTGDDSTGDDSTGDAGTADAPDLPILADAAGVTTVPGGTIYATSTGFDDVVAFYTEELASDGWTLVSTLDAAPGSALLDYTKDGIGLSVVIVDEGGTVTVTLLYS